MDRHIADPFSRQQAAAHFIGDGVASCKVFSGETRMLQVDSSVPRAPRLRTRWKDSNPAHLLYFPSDLQRVDRRPVQPATGSVSRRMSTPILRSSKATKTARRGQLR